MPKSIVSNKYAILTFCFLIITISFGAQNTFGVFFKPMSGEFGWDRATTSGPIAVFLFMYGLLSIVAGRLSDRIGPRKLVTFGGIVFGAGYILMATIHNLWQLYVYYSFIAAIGFSTIYVPLVATVVKIFRGKRGLMSGIVLAGIGLGIGIMPPITSQLIVLFQWRTALLCIGVALVLLIVVLAQLIRPEAEIEVLPADVPTTKQATPELKKESAILSTLKAGRFWSIAAAWFLYGFFYQLILVHVVPYATDIGMSPVAASLIMTTLGLTSVIGRISIGYIGDRWGNRMVTSISFFIMALTFIPLLLGNNIQILNIFAVVFGLLFGVGILCVPVAAENFGVKELGVVSGLIILANCTGCALGPIIGGVLYDKTGSYHTAFILCTACGLAAGLIMLLMKPGKHPARI